MAAELTSMVPAMGAEWIGILQAIMPKGDSPAKSYSDVLTRIDSGNIQTAEQLSVLFGILVARNTLRLSDVLQTVFLCLQRCHQHQNDVHRDPNKDKELKKTQRLCCAFLFVILRSGPPKSHFLTLHADRYLLRACQIGLDLKSLVISLNMLMTIGSDSLLRNLSENSRFISINVPVDPPKYTALDSGTFLRQAPRDISEFAHKIVKIICSEGWVKDKCLRNVENLVQPPLLQMRPEQSHALLQFRLHLLQKILKTFFTGHPG